MNANTKTLLTVCGIASRNGGLPLAKTGKAQRDALLPQPLYPSNLTMHFPSILKPYQKLMSIFRLHASHLCQDCYSKVLG
jgi:hypothetical protein